MLKLLFRLLAPAFLCALWLQGSRVATPPTHFYHPSKFREHSASSSHRNGQELKCIRKRPAAN